MARVTFSVEEEAQIIGENPIASEAGLATILLKTGPKASTIILTAQSIELSGKVTIEAK